MLANPPLYSVDASALIQMTADYPSDVFISMWDFLGQLADLGRLLMAEQVQNECKNPVFKPWFQAHSRILVPFTPLLNEYVNQLMIELPRDYRPLVDPASTKNQADPFVVALALMLEGRDVANLKTGSQRTCCVISYETNAMPKAPLAKIKDVCGHYGLECLRWPQMLRKEAWRI